jgi:hypothetical protein
LLTSGEIPDEESRSDDDKYEGMVETDTG